jgi:hypothetical protein
MFPESDLNDGLKMWRAGGGKWPEGIVDTPQIPTNRRYCPERNSTLRRTARAPFRLLNLDFESQVLSAPSRVMAARSDGGGLRVRRGSGEVTASLGSDILSIAGEGIPGGAGTRRPPSVS